MERSGDIVENPSGDDQQMVKLIELEEKDGYSTDQKQDMSLETPVKTKKSFLKNPWFIALLTFTFILLTLVAWLGLVGYQTYQSALGVQDSAGKAFTAFENRDLGTAKDELENTKHALDRTHSIYRRVMPLSYIPWLGSYIKDGDHAFNASQYGIETAGLVFDALGPYADVLGFAGADSAPLEFTSAEDRIVFLASTVEKLGPQMAGISDKLKLVSNELAMINEKRYPKTLRGIELRDKISSLKNTVGSTATSLADFQPFIKLLPDLLGNPDERKYLILFQNDAELRPTGGFMTAYSTMSILKGKINQGVSEDIYTLDNGFKTKIPAPEPILKYLPLVYNWNLRDMNLSPDFKNSMDVFSSNYKKVPSAPESDAIIAIDTEIPVRILKVLGPIGVPGFGGKFSAETDPRCDCPQVIYELENIITKPTYEIREGRKSILGPLTGSMLANMMGSPKSKWPEFFTIFTDAIREKHLLMYFFDPEKQKAVEALGAAGRINEYNGDYLHINDANFAGAKSNLFVEQEVEQNITIGDDGSVTKKLTLTYKNPRKGDNCNLEAGQLCLNGLLRDWIRIYVPKGSVLKASRGFEVDMTTGEDLGKTDFEGFFTLAPQSVKKLEVEYTTPPGTVSGNDYRLLIQKQPGTDLIKHTITLNGAKPVVYPIDSDQEIVIPR